MKRCLQLITFTKEGGQKPKRPIVGITSMEWKFLFFCCDWCFQFGTGLGCWARKRWTLGKSGSDRGTHTKYAGSFQWKLCLVVHKFSADEIKKYFSVLSSISPYLCHDCNLPLLGIAQNIIYPDFHTGTYWIIHTQQQRKTKEAQREFFTQWVLWLIMTKI